MFLNAFTWVDLRRGLTPEGLERLKWGITGEKPAPSGPTVCLARVTPDLRKARETVANYLASAQINVVPAKPYSADPAKFLTALEADLECCDVFVQLLGPVYSDRSEELPEGEELAQYERAKQRGKVVLQWRERSVDPDSVEDPAHRELLAGADVISNDLTEFAQLVMERTKRVRDVGSTPAAPDSQWLALINADKPDHVVADEISRVFSIGERQLPSHSQRQAAGRMVAGGSL